MTSDFASLLSRLKELPKGTTLEQAVAQIRTPKTPELESARTNAARVRFLDQGVMTVLGNVELNDLVQAFPGDFERVLPDRWTVRSSLRESLLEGMRKNVPDFRSWNTKLYLYYKGLGGKTERLEAVYHAAASSELSEGQKDFEAWFAEANKISDFAYCSALLDVLQLQSGFYGNTFNQSYRDRSRLLQSRLLFLDELKKSGSYLDREKVQEAALKVIQRTGNKPWIFHVHATGGMGKTMFLRWLTARYAVPLRIPCARIDFDEHQNEKLIELVDHPIGLLSMIVDQWAKQMPDTSILSAADTLAKAKTMTGWDSKTLDTYQTLMQSVTVTGPLLLVFDTLEEATLAQLPWLKRCIEELAKLHELLPTLTLVLSGRYDLSSRAVFTAGDATVFEIEGFSHDEASSFLQRRKIAEDLRQAILDPAFDLAKEKATKDGAQAIYNPFKVGLIVELVDERDITSAKEIRSLPDVGVAYLVERVILRIRDQSLRWMIRYGALARRFNREFIEKVLLPPLKDALSGKDQDLAKAGISTAMLKYLATKEPWLANPSLIKQLDAAKLWDEMKAYASDRGWISENKQQQTLLFHPEVAQPLRALLQGQPVYSELHLKFSAYFRDLADPSKPDFLLNSGDAIYHLAQVDPAQAESLWRVLLAKATGPSAYDVAREPTLTDYVLLDDESRRKYPDWFCTAQLECARLKMIEGGTSFVNGDSTWSAFLSHLIAVERLRPDRVPVLWRELKNATLLDPATRTESLEALLGRFMEPEDRLWIHLQAAAYWMTRFISTAARDTSDKKAEKHWLAAGAIVSRNPGMPVASWQIDARLAVLYRQQNRYQDAMAAFDRCRTGNPANSATTIMDCVELALDCHDVSQASVLYDGLHTLTLRPDETLRSGFLALRFQVERYEATPATLNKQGGQFASRDPGWWFTLQGEAAKQSFDYSSAMESFSRATSSFDEQMLSARAREIQVREAELRAFEMENLQEASRFLEKFPPGSFTPSHAARIGLVAIYLDLSKQDVVAARSRFREVLKDTYLRSPRIRARVLLFGAVFDLLEDQRTIALDELRSLIDLVEPPSLFLERLDFIHLASPSVLLKPTGEAAIRPWPKISQQIYMRLEGGESTALLVSLADLACIESQSKDWISVLLNTAIAGLTPPSTPGRWYLGVKLLEAYARCDIPAPFTYKSLLDDPVPELGGSLIEACIQIRAFEEGNLYEDTHKRAVQVWSYQLTSRRREQMLLVKSPRSIESSIKSLKENFVDRPIENIIAKVRPVFAPTEVRHVGIPEVPSDWYKIDLTWKLLSDQTRAIVLIRDLLKQHRRVSRWEQVKSRTFQILDRVEQNRGSEAIESIEAKDEWTQLVTPLGLAHVPWEIASDADVIRGVEKTLIRPTPTAPFKRVLVIKPRNENELFFGIAESIDSGFALEHQYRAGGLENLVDVLLEPDQYLLQQTLANVRPAVIHVVGQMFAADSGVFFDFEGSERRVSRGYGQDVAQTLQTRMESGRLSRIFEPLGIQPVIILDITEPSNRADALRMLLLRNRFAAELFQSGCCKAVLATGLEPPETREELSSLIVDHVQRNAPLGTVLKAIHARPQSPLLNAQTAALFTDDPYATIFGDAL